MDHDARNALIGRLQHCRKYASLLLEVNNQKGGLSKDNQLLLNDVLLKKVKKSLASSKKNLREINNNKYGGVGLLEKIRNKKHELAGEIKEEDKKALAEFNQLPATLDTLIHNIGIISNEIDQLRAPVPSADLVALIKALYDRINALQQAIL